MDASIGKVALVVSDRQLTSTFPDQLRGSQFIVESNHDADVFLLKQSQ